MNAQLISGTAITGTVTGVDRKPLGGVTVTVAGEFTAATAALTTGTPGAHGHRSDPGTAT